MTLPVIPDVETILANSATVLRDVVLPGLTDEWPRSCARVIAGALDYAIGLLHDDRSAGNAAGLEAALGQLADGASVGLAAIVSGHGSVYQRSSAALVWSRETDGPEAVRVRAVLHPVLVAQMEAEAAAAEPLLTALHIAMRGTDE
jgi:hypothetical protein